MAGQVMRQIVKMYSGCNRSYISMSQNGLGTFFHLIKLKLIIAFFMSTETMSL